MSYHTCMGLEVGSTEHWVAVIGGATAGAEVAAHLADRGVNVVVFDQNARPYGKIEDGLPRWHEALRRKECHHIDEKLSRPRVRFVPLTKIGRDIDFAQLANEWGFSVVILASGAWRDRRLPVPGIDSFVGRGFAYQNPFVIAFNHAEDPGHAPLDLPDGALVIGGGLAALDVAKIFMLETTRQALRRMNLPAPLVELEHKGIPAYLHEHGLAWADLGLQGCTVMYRRREEDMPLVEAHDDSEQQQDKAHKVRLRILHHAQEKFLFRVQSQVSPVAALAKGDRLVGLRFRRFSESPDPGSGDDLLDVTAPLVVSAIGSIPEPIKGVPQSGELFDFSDPHLGRLPGYPNVFAVGNVVTGRGNISASRKHAREISETAVAAFLGLLPDRGAEGDLAQTLSAPARTQAQTVANAVNEQLQSTDPPQHHAIADRVLKQQQRVGYEGNYAAWIAAHSVTPPA